MKRDAPEEQPGRLYLSSIFERAKELKLKPSQRLILTALFKYLGRKDFCWPTQRMLAEDTGLEVRQIRRILDKLASVGVINRDKRRTTGRLKGNNAYEYRLALSQSSETKADISDQTKPDICDSQSGHLEHVKPDICDSQSGHLRLSKVPQKQASRERAGAEYIKEIDHRNKSSISQRKNDGLRTDGGQTNSRKKPAVKKSLSSVDNATEEQAPPPAVDLEDTSFEHATLLSDDPGNYEPPPGAPPRLLPEQAKKIWEGCLQPPPVNLLDCEGVNLGTLGLPFKGAQDVQRVVGIIGFNPDIPQKEWFENALKEFYGLVIDRHWNSKSEPPGSPFRRLFFRVGRSGLLYQFGFCPLGPEQLEARRRIIENRKKEAVEAARREKEELRQLAEKNAKLEAFISRPICKEYLLLNGLSLEDYEAVRNHLRKIVAGLNGRGTLSEVERFMKEKVQTAKAAKRRREQVAELRQLANIQPRLVEYFAHIGLVPEGEWVLADHEQCLDRLLAVREGLQTDSLSDMAESLLEGHPL